jgi:hypothetical protein
MFVLLHRHEVVDLLRQLAAQHRAAASLHAVLFVPRLAYWAQKSSLKRVMAA